MSENGGTFDQTGGPSLSGTARPAMSPQPPEPNLATFDSNAPTGNLNSSAILYESKKSSMDYVSYSYVSRMNKPTFNMQQIMSNLKVPEIQSPEIKYNK